jgi:hypothetical protein
LGLLPIMFETSLQAQLVIPMTLSLGWGILFGTVLTLLMIPSLYLILDDFMGLFIDPDEEEGEGGLTVPSASEQMSHAPH